MSNTANKMLKDYNESMRVNDRGFPSTTGYTPATTGGSAYSGGTKPGIVYAKNTGFVNGTTGTKATPTKTETTQTADSGTNGTVGAYMQLAAAQMAANQQRANESLAAQREAAQNAYNRGLSNLAAAYNNRMSMLGDNYNSTVGQLNDAYNASAGNVNADADAALKQAYINNMLNQKNLGQQLTAQGLSGGASESTLARLLNNYGNSRNNIETNRNTNLKDLAQTLNTSLAQALQSYNNAKAEADAQRLQYAMNLENALANNEISTMQNYQDALTSNSNNYMAALADAVDKMNKYNYTKGAATNDVNLATVLQNAVNGIPTNNANVAKGAVENGANTSTLAQATTDNSMLDLIRALYGV